MNILTYPMLDSTNDEAKRLLTAGQLAPGSTTLILADVQTAGRGTRGRHWQSPTGGLYMTLIHTAEDANASHWLSRLHPPASVALTLAAGIACQQVLNDVIFDATGQRPVVLKPINDLMLSAPDPSAFADVDWVLSKLGGILVETQLSPTGKLNAVITGVGVNLTTAPEVDYPTASLAQVMHAKIIPDPQSLGEPMSGMISRWYESLL